MRFCGIQYISVLHAEIKLGVTPNGIPKVDLAISLNRIFTHTRTPSTAMIKLLLHTVQIKYNISKKFRPLIKEFNLQIVDHGG
jgi:hypothetical protein